MIEVCNEYTPRLLIYWKHDIVFGKFLGSMSMKIYREGNYILDHSFRGYGDSSCVLCSEMIKTFTTFDVVFVQSISWWTNIPKLLNSPKSPKFWVDKMMHQMYYDSMKHLLGQISKKTFTVLVLGHIGSDCRNKTVPQKKVSINIPTNYGWQKFAEKLWMTSIQVVEENKMDVKIIDVREPLAQSIHAHPSKASPSDCLHFCMNSAAINHYLDAFWNEVFSKWNISPLWKKKEN